MKVIREALRKAHLSSVAVKMRSKKIDFSGVAVDEVANLGRALAKIRLS